jgi:tetratricopeptide (TPR) repeat protein
MSLERKTSILVVAALGAVFGGYFYLHRAPKLTEKDFILLADFTNTTGDAVFNGTLRQGLATKLEESTFLNVVSDQKIAETLRHMGQPADLGLSQDLATRVCEHTGSVAVIDGSIANLEDEYVVGLNAVNCKTGESLAQEQVTSEDKEHVLAALGKAATELRAKLGESHAPLSQFNIPLVEATTSSMEALRAYSLGMRAFNNAAFEGSVPFFHRAINLDPNFVMAYAALGETYYRIREPGPAADNLKKAYELRDRVTARENFEVSGQYSRFVVGDLEKAARTYDVWGQTYLRDSRPHNYLSAIYKLFGQFDKSLAEARDAVQIEPSRAENLVGLFYTYLALNREDEALATATQALANKLDSSDLHLGLCALAFIKNDAAGMAHELAWAMGEPEVEREMIYFEADSTAYTGQLAKANTLTQKVVVDLAYAKENETVAKHKAGAALRAALYGMVGLARGEAITALRVSADRDVEAVGAIALALAGDTPEAQRLADDLAKRFPDDTLVKFNYLPTIRGSIALAKNAASKTIEELQTASPYELGTVPCELSLMSVYIRAQAYLLTHDGSAAAAEFQKILDHRGVVITEPIGALAHLGLGRAYALQGDRAKARIAYQDFLSLWKEADADIPVLQEAKAESLTSQ